MRSNNPFFLIGLTFGTTKSLRQTFYSADNGEAVPIKKDTITISLEKAVQQVRFSGDESLLLISLKGGSLSVYNVDDILTKVNLKEWKTLTNFR